MLWSLFILGRDVYGKSRGVGGNDKVERWTKETPWWFKVRHWAVYYTSPQTMATFLVCLLNNLGDFYLLLIGWIIYLNFQTFQRLILIYSRGYFVYHYWRCKSIYRPLSYPLKYKTVLLFCRKDSPFILEKYKNQNVQVGLW